MTLVPVLTTMSFAPPSMFELDAVVVEGDGAAGFVFRLARHLVGGGVAASHLERQLGTGWLLKLPVAVRHHHHVGDEGIRIARREHVELGAIDFHRYARGFARHGDMLVRGTSRHGRLSQSEAEPRHASFAFDLTHGIIIYPPGQISGFQFPVSITRSPDRP